MRLDNLRREGDIGRANGFMRVLGSGFGFAGAPLPNIGLTVFLTDIGLDSGLSFLGDTGGVGTHVGDETLMTALAHFNAFIELLRETHGFFGLKVEPRRCVLLHCTGGIRQIWLAALLFLLDLQDGVGRAFQIGQDGVGFFFGTNLDTTLSHLDRFGPIPPIEVSAFRAVASTLFSVSRALFAIELGNIFEASDEIGFKAFLLSVFTQQRCDTPVLLWKKGAYLGFTVANEPESHRLDTPGACSRLNAPPEQWADLITDQAIQHPARLLRVEEVFIDLPWLLDGLLHRPFGNFIEDRAMRMLQAQGFF